MRPEAWTAERVTTVSASHIEGQEVSLRRPGVQHLVSNFNTLAQISGTIVQSYAVWGL